MSKKKVFYRSVENGLFMCTAEYRGKIAYIWITPHPAKSGTLLRVVVVVIVVIESLKSLSLTIAHIRLWGTQLWGTNHICERMILGLSLQRNYRESESGRDVVYGSVPPKRFDLRLRYLKRLIPNSL